MELNAKDCDVVKWLKKLKDTEVSYPFQLFVARRQLYLQYATKIRMTITAGVTNTFELRRMTKEGQE